MRLIFFIYLISTLFNFIDVFAQKIKEDQSQLNSVKWEKVKGKSNSLKKIIWKSFNNDKGYFEDENFENKLEKSIKDTEEKSASSIQRIFRGKQGRKKANENKKRKGEAFSLNNILPPQSRGLTRLWLVRPLKVSAIKIQSISKEE